ncbi:MAG: HWE histidine kinase domain-containing protein [Pseudomonadota bacterium]
MARRDATGSATLIAEHRHEIRNLFAVILGLVSVSGRGRTDGQGVMRDIHSRVQALSHAYQASQDQPEAGSVGLGDVLFAVLAPRRAGSRPIDLTGAPVDVPVDAAAPLALIMNELANNAASHGTLSAPKGRIDVSWTCVGSEISVRWQEFGGPCVQSDTEDTTSAVLIRHAAQQLQGHLSREWNSAGLCATLHFPMRQP